GRLVGGRLLLQPLVAVEGMLLTLESLLVGELAAGLEDVILCTPMLGIGANELGLHRNSRGRGATAVRRTNNSSSDLRNLQAGCQAFEIALLLRLEITRHRGSPDSRSSGGRRRSFRGNLGANRERGCFDGGARLVGHVERQSGEGESADQIAE